MPPPKIQGFREFLWNSEEKQFLGRTGGSWLRIFVFYVIFYACLAAFWAACLVIFLQTINMREPRWTTNTDSIIGSNPGLGYRPGPPEKKIESTLIMFNDGPGENWGHWVKELDTFVAEHDNLTDAQLANMRTCNYSTTLGEREFCDMPVSALGTSCTSARKFGYPAGKPCIIVKLNNIFNWEPTVYHAVSDLPSNMPKDARRQIASQFADRSSGNITEQNVWITCEGENPADAENIGEVVYHPHPGMPTYYYPFKNVDGYRSPLVAVEFSGVRKGVLINIECKAWAKNIRHDRKQRRGSVHLELMVD